MKGVILCAGRGTRLQPFSFSLPKTLLPVANQPVIDYCIEKFVNADIREIGVVLNPGQRDVTDYLSKYTELDIQLFFQKQPRGIADAIKMARSFVGADSFLVLLGDNLVEEPLVTILDAFSGHSSAILLAHVENPSDYGVASLDQDRVVKVEEKPKKPQSNLAIVGIYAFTPDIFEAIDDIRPSARGEYEITEAIQWLIDHGQGVSYAVTSNPFFDVGTVERWLEANRWLLRERFGHDVFVGNNTHLENCTLKGPLVIGDNCVMKDTTLGPYVSIQDGSTLVNCSLTNSICLSRSTLQNIKLPIVSSIFGRDSRFELDPGIDTELRCIVSDKSRVAPH
jgi:glucose-1-phosphate thymidylyltransferase